MLFANFVFEIFNASYASPYVRIITFCVSNMMWCVCVNLWRKLTTRSLLPCGAQLYHNSQTFTSSIQSYAPEHNYKPFEEGEGGGAFLTYRQWSTHCLSEHSEPLMESHWLSCTAIYITQAVFTLNHSMTLWHFYKHFFERNLISVLNTAVAPIIKSTCTRGAKGFCL